MLSLKNYKFLQWCKIIIYCIIRGLSNKLIPNNYLERFSPFFFLIRCWLASWHDRFPYFVHRFVLKTKIITTWALVCSNLYTEINHCYDWKRINGFSPVRHLIQKLLLIFLLLSSEEFNIKVFTFLLQHIYISWVPFNHINTNKQPLK